MKKWISRPDSLEDKSLIYVSEVKKDHRLEARMSGWRHLPEPGLYHLVKAPEQVYVWKNTRPTFKHKPDRWDDMCGAEGPGQHPVLCTLNPGHDGYHKAW
jgi:hypothetical protein